MCWAARPEAPSPASKSCCTCEGKRLTELEALLNRGVAAATHLRIANWQGLLSASGKQALAPRHGQMTDGLQLAYCGADNRAANRWRSEKNKHLAGDVGPARGVFQD